MYRVARFGKQSIGVQTVNAILAVLRVYPSPSFWLERIAWLVLPTVIDSR